MLHSRESILPNNNYWKLKRNGKKVPHLTVQGEQGPVMILLMPDEKVTAVTPVEGESVHGLIIPVGNGSIAVIGEREEALEPIRKNVVDSITWTT